jgi:hypothetical protein
VNNFEKVKARANPDSEVQCNIKLSRRLIVSAEQLADIETYFGGKRVTKRDIVRQALEQYIAVHPHKESLEEEVATRFRNEQDYLQLLMDIELDRESTD